MGLLLSILVFSVGVLEALACVRHIQQGILPSWAPRHVTTPSGRRLLRERWRKSTSRDEGGEVPAEAAGESPPTAAVPRARPAPLQLQERAGSPALHRARTPDIHWPEPVPHSPAKSVEQTLPSPVEEAPGDVSWPAGDILAGRRRTSVTETLPPLEHAQAEPLAPTEAEFARETQEPSRCKPAKASSFEEARVEPAFQAPEPAFPEVTSAPRQPDVINLSFEDHSAAGPRAAVVGRIQITATKEGSGDEEPEPWPIVNIDTVGTSDDEGDVTPPANSDTRRVSFDPTPTVVSFDKEKPVASEETLNTQFLVPPTVKVTHDVEDFLQKQMPAFIDQIIQEAVLKASEELTVRGKGGGMNDVSLFLQDIITKGDHGVNGQVDNENVEEYKDSFEANQEQSSKKVAVPGVGDNIYRIMEKLQRGEELVDMPEQINDTKPQTAEVMESENQHTSFKSSENESDVQTREKEETFQPNDIEQLNALQPPLSATTELNNNYSKDVSRSPEALDDKNESENIHDVFNNDAILVESHPAYFPDKQAIEFKESTRATNQPIFQEEKYSDNAYNNDDNETNQQLEIENNVQIIQDTSLNVTEERSSLIDSPPSDIEKDIIPKEIIQSTEMPQSIMQEGASDENVTSPPTLASAAFSAAETVASSAPLTSNNGPEEAKEAEALAKQVSPGPQGPLDEAQITRASAAADSADTRISTDEPHTFDIEPGPPASQDVRSAPQSLPEKPASSPEEGLSPASSAESVVSSRGKAQDTPRTASPPLPSPPPSPPPPPPSPSPPPQLAPAPTTDKQQQQEATDSTPSADRNEISRTKDKKKKKHILRKRSSKEKRGKRVQTPQASRSASEDEGDTQESTTATAPAVAPSPPSAPVTQQPPPPVPAPPSAAAEPEVSARETTLVTSSSISSSSSGAAAPRPTTPAAAPQQAAFWVRDSPHPPPAPASDSTTSTPFGPCVKKPYRRKPPAEADMPGFATKSSRFEWPPKFREERPIRSRSAAFSAAAPADSKEHFPPPPPPEPERPPTPLVPEPTPDQTVAAAAVPTAASPTPDASSPIPATAPSPSPVPADAATEQPVANGTAPNDTAAAAAAAAAAEEADAARDAAASPVPGRFKFEVEMPTTRPTIQPKERDPKEVVRKLSHLKKENPGVASEMLMSILGFQCPH